MRVGQSGTSAKQYITLIGSKGKVLRQRLCKGNSNAIAPNSTSVFRVRGPDIGQLNTVIG